MPCLRHVSSQVPGAALFLFSSSTLLDTNKDHYAGAEVAMDRADVEIEEEEDGVEKSSWSAAFLRRSWWIGKRLAITGAAITSAPVIIPFLFVLSTLGIAFSFPFGVYLAGYVCTDKFMRVLLPLPPFIEGGLDVDRGDEVVLDEEQWEKREILESERERSVMEAGVEGEVEGVGRGERIGEEDEMVKGVELRNDADVVKELRKCDSAKEIRAGVEKVGEDVAAAFESSGSPKSPYTVVVMAANEASDKREYEPPNLSSEHLSLVELGGEGKVNDTSVTEEQREDCGEEEKRLRAANGAMTKDKELSKEGNTVVPRLKSDYVLSAVIVPSEDENAEILESVGSMKHRSFGKPLSAAAVAAGVAGSHSHDEISSFQRTHNEEQLWDQIFSMRAIVGYKATLQPSLGEELIALFLFIGVEPPVSLKDSTDLVEISNSLQFLKSVVGVK